MKAGLVLAFAGWSIAPACLCQWDTVGSGMNDGVRSLLYDSAAQRLYAFGHFSVAGGVIVNGTTYWDGTWHPMGQGVHYPQAFPVMTASFWGDSILISGSFPYAYGVANSQRAVVWDGSAWLALEPGGIDGFIGTVISNEDGATVSGILDTIAGVPVTNNIARYVNGAWSPICSHPTDGIMWLLEMAHYQGQYFFAGNLNSPSVKELGWLDGDTLRQVGQGILGDSWVNDLVVFQDKLFIGGDFFAGAGNPATALMTWDGTQYANPVPGVQFIAQVADLDVRNGELYISGRTMLPGSSDYYSLARFDGDRVCCKSPREQVRL